MKKHLILPLAVAAGLLPAVALAQPPRQFLSDAIRGDNAEVALGQLAQRRGQSREVRAYGAMLARDHASAKAAAEAASRQLRIPPARGFKPEGQTALLRLQRLSGAQFDRAFARMMIEHHTKDVGAFQQQARHGEPVTARLARNTLPTLRHHLTAARRLP